MSTREIDIGEFDVVKLIDGREATVLEVFRARGRPAGYLVEISGTRMETEEVSPDQIKEIVWKMPG
jgi:hypothetical protein